MCHVNTFETRMNAESAAYLFEIDEVRVSSLTHVIQSADIVRAVRCVRVSNELIYFIG